MKRIRHWLIREGLLNPSSLKETRDIFKFPVKVKENKKTKSMWMKYHVQRIDNLYP